jgi:transposase-like protein
MSAGVAEPAAGEMYPVVFFDAMRVKIRDEGGAKKRQPN